MQDYAGSQQFFTLPADMRDALVQLGKAHGSTLPMVLLAAFSALLFRYSGQGDIVIGTPSSNRNQLGLDEVIGFLVNTLVMRHSISCEMSFTELLSQVRATSIEAYQHQDMPFDKLVDLIQPQRSQSWSPLYQVMFAFQDSPYQPFKFSGLELSSLGHTKKELSKFDIIRWNNRVTDDLTLILEDNVDGLGACIEYSTALFDASTIVRFIGHFKNLLQNLIKKPQSCVGDLSIINDEEYHQLITGFNHSKRFYAKTTLIHELFQAQVSQQAHAIALVSGDNHLTYNELNQRANRLARYLVRQDVVPGDIVGLFTEHRFDTLVGLLATLKAGAAYVPIDTCYPEERIRFLLDDARPRLVLTQSYLAKRLTSQNVRFICLDKLATDLRQELTDNVTIDTLTASNLAYIIYTSGSSGKPKGVMVEHRNIVNLVSSLKQDYKISSVDRVLQFASFCFDVSIEEYFGALCHGATLVFRNDDCITSVKNFWSYCDFHRISFVNLPTAFWHQLVNEKNLSIPTCLRCICIGGEAVKAESLNAWFARTGYRPQLINAYGPTETTVTATIAHLNEKNASPNIGRPIANTQAYIVDTQGWPVPIGIAGELWISGDGVSRGYLCRPALTEKYFIPNKFSEANGQYIYKTGDLCRWLDNGKIEYLGRMDKQIKLRGFRIEPAEVEAAISKLYPTVHQTFVTLQSDQSDQNNQYLVAYLVGLFTQDITHLKRKLKTILPIYMVPTAYVVLDELPVTNNGKIDKEKLPRPERNNFADDLYQLPQGEVEHWLADYWQSLLQIERVGCLDNFFELGGHSLLITQLITAVNSHWSVKLSLSDIYGNATLEAIARMIEEERLLLSLSSEVNDSFSIPMTEEGEI